MRVLLKLAARSLWGATLLLACAGCRSTAPPEDHTAALRPEGPYLLRAAYDLWRELPPRNADGSLNIVETWFTYYKGNGQVVSGGLAERGVALGVLQEAAAAFVAHR